MATNSESAPSGDDHTEVPEVLSAVEHGTITLAFRDERVNEDDGFEQPNVRES